MKSNVRMLGALVAGLLALTPPTAAQAQDETFRDKVRATFGFDGGKRRVQRESLVRGPDGGWCLETPGGLTPHPCQAEYTVAEDLFRREQYRQAATAFRRLGEKYRGSALEEECIFFEAESYFKDSRLPSAVDAFHKLLKEYPTTRHLGHAVQRTYDVAGEWLEDSRLRSQGQPGKYAWWNRHVNFFDRRRPTLDTAGRAIEAIEHIQQYDPNGPLTATAVMMAGAEKFTNGDYIRAAGYYEQVTVSAPKSEHAAKAAMLSAQSYMRSYQGPGYDVEDLLKAQQMTEAALRRAAELTPEQKQMLELDLKKIYDMQAERSYHDGMTFMGMRKYRGAKYCFDRTIKRFPETQWAERAKAELANIEPRLAASPEPTELRYKAEPTFAMPKIDWSIWRLPSLRPGGDGNETHPGASATDDPDVPVKLTTPAPLPKGAGDAAVKLPAPPKQ